MSEWDEAADAQAWVDDLLRAATALRDQLNHRGVLPATIDDLGIALAQVCDTPELVIRQDLADNMQRLGAMRGR